MWQDDTEAVKASSGSTALSSEKGRGTERGEEEPRTDRAAVEGPVVGAGVAAFPEIAVADPVDGCGVFVAHVTNSLFRLLICLGKLWVPSNQGTVSRQ